MITLYNRLLPYNCNQCRFIYDDKNYRNLHISIIYKVVDVISLVHEPVDRFVSNFDWGPRENHVNVFGLV